MTRTILRLTLVPVLAVLAAATAAGDMIAPPLDALKVAPADAVVVGKVTAIADKAEKAELYKDDRRGMKIATVKVSSALLGKAGTTLKVGFIDHGPGRRRFPTANLTKDQEALLILTRHPSKKGVFILANYYDVVDKKGKTENFKAEVEEVKKAAKLMASPMTALKSKNADDRLLAAALLITRYKSSPAGGTKTEAVPAGESKLILTALAEADWSDTGGVRDWQMHPRNLFSRLAVTSKDGWEQPNDFKLIAPAAKMWLKDNAAKYKMTRFVREKVGVEPDPEP